MSLINDALKRAGQKPATTLETAAGLQPAEERSNGFPVLTLLIVLIPLIALGIWFLAKGLQMNDQKAQVKPAPEAVAHARTPEVPAPVSVAPVLVTIVTNIVAPPVTAAPAYKLQGLYWRPSKPSAVINGKTVYVGDRVENARVTAIDQESVTITIDGQPKVLQLP